MVAGTRGGGAWLLDFRLLRDAACHTHPATFGATEGGRTDWGVRWRPRLRRSEPAAEEKQQEQQEQQEEEELADENSSADSEDQDDDQQQEKHWWSLPLRGG
jgi:hypothetical protein